jgi:transcriptional regulator with XRE-family HTH domain
LNDRTVKLEEIGNEIRRFRRTRGLTQLQLATAAHVTRTTLNQLENGLLKELGIRKVQTILDQVGLVLKVADASVEPKSTDFLRLASTSASVSFKDALTEKELLRVLLTGKVPAERRPHIRLLLEEAPRSLVEGLAQQVARWARPGKVERNLDKIAADVGVAATARKWWTQNG